ncbi:MAG: hypothetical protein KTR26_20410 [Flammeovirgaceae bacterium]|nr:hypothetical protein [Flammeovirgaceae bacterium]
MRKNITGIGLILMIVINVILIFLLVSGPPMKGKEGIAKVISSKLKLNNEQERLFFELAKKHRIEVNQLEEKQKELLKSYFSQLKDAEVDSAVSNNILHQLEKVEREKITVTFQHFADLKNLCKREQIIHYQGIMDDVLRVLLKEFKKKLPPPRDF